MDNTSDLRGRLKWLLEVSGLSGREASKRAKQSSPAYVGMLMRGDIDDAKTHTVRDIAAVFGVSPGWLAYGDEPSPTAESVRAAVGASSPVDGPTVDRSPEYTQEQPAAEVR